MVRQGDTTFQDEAAVLPKNYQVRITRDMSAASGSVSYTGVGFRPSCIYAFGGSITDQTVSWAMSNGSLHGCQFTDNTGTWVNTTSFFLRIYQGANRQDCSFTSFDADGWTLNWTKVGTPAANTAVLTCSLEK
jgi:hypothetical protein